MVHETAQTAGKEKLHGHGEDDISVVEEETEIIEISTKSNALYEHINRVLEKIATTRMGQMVMEKADRVLKVVEDTAKWSLPQDDADVQLERPLPWIFFLTLIVSLRIFRIWLSIGYFIVRLQPVTPYSLVNYLETTRHNLRTIRVKGLKTIKNREIESSSNNNSPQFMGKLGRLLASAICRSGEYYESPDRCVFSQDDKTVQDLGENRSKRQRDDDDDDDDDNDDDDDDASDNNLTTSEMLEKYANEDSDNDSDYVPNDDEDDDDDDDDESSTSHASTSSAEETEKEYKSDETQNGISEPQKDRKDTEEQKKEEIKANGERQYNSILMPLKHDQFEIHTGADSDNEQMHTPKEIPDTNGVAATTEVAPKNATNMSKATLNHLAFPQMAENTMKSTPGHESAASQKPVLPTAANAGSLQDFHSIFHPAPIVKGVNGEAKTSTPKEADVYESSTSETTGSMAAGNQKKNVNPSNHNKHYYYFNSKNRSKIRR